MATEVLQKCAKLASEPMQTNEQQAIMCTERNREGNKRIKFNCSEKAKLLSNLFNFKKL